MQRDWIDYASAAGSIATALTLIYLVIKEWKTRKHITDLSVIAKELQEQHGELRQQNELQKMIMKVDARPNLRFSGVSSVEGGLIGFSFHNHGKVAYLTKIEASGLFFNTLHNPIVIEHATSVRITGNPPHDKNPEEVWYHVIIHLQDFYGNKYLGNLSGRGYEFYNLEVQDVYP